MTKADIVSNISKNLGIEKVDVQLTVESLMKEIINSLENGENVNRVFLLVRVCGFFADLFRVCLLDQLRFLPELMEGCTHCDIQLRAVA